MAAMARWWGMVVVLFLLCESMNALPLGAPRPYHHHHHHHGRRSKREIEVQNMPKPRPGSSLHALEFMMKFGYVENKGDDMSDYSYTQQSLQEALIRVQKFGGIPTTGELDEATVKLMETPRCGLPDLNPEDFNNTRHNRVKRYIIGSGGWNKRNITYYLANWTPQLYKKETVQEELRRAFDTWSTYSYLSFSEVSHPDADIIIYFATADHGDGYPFDYSGGILAHAFYPYEFGSYGGDVHFDESEKWIKAKDEHEEGLDFFTVAVHELGHSLGLSHSPVDGSIMYPYYKGYKSSFSLDYDDVMAMWKLYIERRLEGDDEYFNKTRTTTTTTIKPDTGHQSDEASGGDTADTDNDTEHDEEEEEEEEDMYEKDKKKREEIEKTREEERRRNEEERRRQQEEEDIRRREEEVRKTEEEEKRRWEEEEERRWEEERRRREGEREEDENSVPSIPPSATPSIPDLCDGDFDAMAVLRQELFIFKGKYLWRYRERGQLYNGYPTTISTLFPGLPENLEKVNAVYERNLDGNIVFFIGPTYYVHDGNSLVEGSPHPLTRLGLPSHVTLVEAAFYWPRANKTYFFTHDGYYRYNSTAQHMDIGYPKNMNKWNGIPEHIDTVFTWKDGQSYFVKGQNYWLYDDYWIRPAPGYPKNVKTDWAKCFTSEPHSSY